MRLFINATTVLIFYVPVRRGFLWLFEWHPAVTFLINYNFRLNVSLFCPPVPEIIKIYVSVLFFWPGALGLFQLPVGILLKFVWLFRCDILCVYCGVVWFFIWSNDQLIVSVCITFQVSKVRFWINMYPERNRTLSVLSEFILTWLCAKTEFSLHSMPFPLCFILCMLAHSCPNVLQTYSLNPSLCN